jgi:hypothetical protein
MRTAAAKSQYQTISLASIHGSTTNPRRSFDEAKLAEFADFVPGHKIGILFRSPFCCRGSGEPRGKGRLPFVRGT